MKKLFWLWALISMVLLTFTGTSIAGKTALEEIYGAKTLVVSTDANYAPQAS